MWTAAAASRGRTESCKGLNFSHCRCTAGGLTEKDGEMLAFPQARFDSEDGKHQCGMFVYVTTVTLCP